MTGAADVLEKYKRAQQSFKQNCQERLSKLIKEQEEIDRKNALPNYMSWRPKHYRAEMPKRNELYLTEALHARRQNTRLEQMQMRKQMLEGIESQPKYLHTTEDSSASAETQSSLHVAP